MEEKNKIIAIIVALLLIVLFGNQILYAILSFMVEMEWQSKCPDCVAYNDAGERFYKGVVEIETYNYTIYIEGDEIVDGDYSKVDDTGWFDADCGEVYKGLTTNCSEVKTGLGLNPIDCHYRCINYFVANESGTFKEEPNPVEESKNCRVEMVERPLGESKYYEGEMVCK